MTSRPFMTPVELQRALATTLVIDVRKPKARAESGIGIAGSVYRHPFDALNWASNLGCNPIVVYCVHGHEVSRAVAGYLRDLGHDSRYLEGGMEAWIEAGLPAEAVSDA